MKKLRKMLGKLEDPEVKAIMDLIPTQSVITLARWGFDYAMENYYPIYLEYNSHNTLLVNKIEEVKGLLANPRKAKIDMKELRKQASTIQNPIELASYRALITMLNIYNTPTNSLGFLWYGAALMAYSKLGLESSDEMLDKEARCEFARAYEALEKVCIQDEVNQAKIDWGC